MSETLKPCPFCGGDHLTYVSEGGGYQVYCKQCRGAMWSLTREGAFELWNHRAPGPATCCGDGLSVVWLNGEKFVKPGLATAESQLRRARVLLDMLCKGYRAGGFGLWEPVELAEAFLAEHGAARPEGGGG